MGIIFIFLIEFELNYDIILLLANSSMVERAAVQGH